MLNPVVREGLAVLLTADEPGREANVSCESPCLLQDSAFLPASHSD